MALEFKTETDLNNAISDLSNSKYRFLHRNILDYINKADILLTKEDEDFIKSMENPLVETIYRKEIVTNISEITCEINGDKIPKMINETDSSRIIALLQQSLNLENLIPILEYEYKYISEAKKYKLVKIYLYTISTDGPEEIVNKGKKTIEPISTHDVESEEFLELNDGDIFYYLSIDKNKNFIVYDSDKEAFLDLDRIKSTDFLNTDLPKRYIGNLYKRSKNISAEYKDSVHNYAINKFLVYPITGYFDYMYLRSNGFISIKDAEEEFIKNMNTLISDLSNDDINGLGIFDQIVYTNNDQGYEKNFENSRWLGTLKKKDYLYNASNDTIVELALNNKLDSYNIVIDESTNIESTILVPSLYISEKDMNESFEYLSKIATLVLKEKAATFVSEEETVNWDILKENAAELKTQLSTYQNIRQYITESAREILEFFKSATPLVHEQLNVIGVKVRKFLKLDASKTDEERTLDLLDFLDGDVIFVAFKLLYNLYRKIQLRTSFQINTAKLLAILNELFEYDDSLVINNKLKAVAESSVKFKNLYEKTVGKIKNDDAYNFFK